MLFLSSVNSVPTAARFCNPSNTPVPRLASSPLLRLRPWNNLLPTLSVTYSGRVSSFHASTICRCYSSSSLLQSEPAQERTSPFRYDVAIDSLVQIFYLDTTAKPLQPWDKSTKKKEWSQSGFIISGRRILTTAYNVSDDTSLLVRKFRSPTVYTAKFEAVGHGCDLAILVVDCEEFWENTRPLELDDDLPSIGQTVSLFTFDEDTIKFTETTVSSLETTKYFHGTAKLLSIGIESYYSGPVFLGNKIVGLRPGLGYIIPSPVIKHILNGFDFGSLDLSYQTMKDARLRTHFGMSQNMTGVLITKMDPLSKALKVLKQHDVILAIEGFPVDEDGIVHFQKKEWLSLDDVVFMKKPNETALVRVLRDGKEHTLNVSLSFSKHRLVPYDFLPSYYIIAGFVFVPLCEPYIKESDVICECELTRVAKKVDEQIVIISQVLVDDINKEYTDFKDFEVKKVNGVEIVNLKHLIELIEKCCTEDLRFDLQQNYVIVLNNKSAKEATSLILERNGIPSAMSSDLQ